MSARPVLRRPRVLAAAAATIALGASLAVAAPAQATGGLPALQPRTYAASLVSPVGPITRGVVTPFQIKVVNTSTTISALDRIRVTIPAGFAVSLTGASVSAPRGGWTESLSGSTLTVATNKPLTSALRKGEALTFTFSAKATPTSCAAMPSTWPLQVDGIFLVYSTSGAPITTTVPAVADSFAVTSVTDVDGVLSGNQVKKDVPFSISGAFQCGSTPAPAGSAGTITLTTPSTGTLGGTSAAVAAGDLTTTLNAVTYNKAENAVPIAVAWNGALSGTVTVDVLGASQTAPGGDGPITLTVPGGTAGLGNGSTGPVSLALVACDPAEQTAAPCGRGTEIDLTGNFKGRYGYGTAAATGVTPKPTDLLAPASLTWTCTDCAHHDATSVLAHVPGTPNPDCAVLFSCYKSSAAPFGLRDVEEDFADYQVWVSMSDGNGGYTDFKAAGRCVSTPSIGEDDWWKFNSYLTSRSHFLHTTGVIEDATAQHLGFCVDVNSITRDATGLHIPVLFVEDPRLRP